MKLIYLYMNEHSARSTWDAGDRSDWCINL